MKKGFLIKELRSKILLFAMSMASIGVYGQTIFDGASITSTAQTVGNVTVLSTGSIKNGNICNSPTKVDYLEIGSSPIYLELRIPDHATKDYRVALTASHNSQGTSTNGVAVLFSDESPFNEAKAVFGKITTAGFKGYDQSCNTIEITPPPGTKSMRVYRRIYVNNTTGILQTGSSGSTSYGDNSTIRLSSVAIWATARPTVQTSNFIFNNVTTTSMNVSFTRGDGSNVAVFAREDGAGSITLPADNSNYNASTDWTAKGSQLSTSGYFCVYNGTESSFSLSNLNPDKSYTFQAFEYSGTSTSNKYLTTTATKNPASQATKPLTVPTLTTNPVTPIFSTKGTSGGIITDNGGMPITETGLVWSTSPNPTIAGAGKLKIGENNPVFNGQIKGLTPSTIYYVRAYAINSIGTAYGNEVIFTTAAPAPILASSVTSINFGDQFYKETPAVLTYNLVNNGANFSTATGNITVTATGGFLVSTNSTTGFAASITVPYTNSKLASTPIYVKLPTNFYGNFSGVITHSGANVLAGDADQVTIKGSVVQQEISNKGTDFWLGFGYMTDMNNTGSPANLTVYIAGGEQDAMVTVSMPGVNDPTFPRTVFVAANSVVAVEGFPTADNAKNPLGSPDSRLFSTGVFNRGININSNGVPVSVWMYTWTKNDSAAGAMVFPTNTWSSSYTVQAYGNTTNNKAPNSFFFVVANEDNTDIVFTPSNPILKGTSAEMFLETPGASNILYDANTPYHITLNKGQIFNAMGTIGAGKVGLDLSGTTVKTNCDKKIAVFAGNGRSFATSSLCASPGSGSDNLIQQMFPNVAWGTQYLTAPTKSMEYNVFRIYVNDITSKVRVNGTLLSQSNLINNLYYEKEANQPLSIESDKPINVTQLVLSEGCASQETIGNNGQGDPEMIILSPVQQAIKSTTVYSPNFKNANSGSGASYINVIIKKEGVASFKLDNKTLALDTGATSFDAATRFASSDPVDVVNAFKPHPGNPAYYFAKFKVEKGQIHSLSSAYPFNAIAYGMTKGESYGFNAGATVQNLSSIKLAVNATATDTSSTTVKVAKGVSSRLKIALPYPPATVANLLWAVPSADATISPAGSQNGAVASGAVVYESTTVVDGRTYYVYASPVQYTFSEAGNHNISVIASGSFAGDCAGSDTQKINVLVGLDDINIAYTTNCGDPTISFTNTTTPMEGTTIKTWLWDFGDGTTSNLQNPPAHTYNKANGTVYTVKLTTTNSAGIQTSKTLNVDFSGAVTAKFTNNAVANAVCLGNEVKFDPASSAITSTVSGTFNKWTWNFGDGTAEVVVNGAVKTVQPHTYAATGQYTVTLKAETTTGCSNTFTQTINVFNLLPTVVTSTPTLNSITFNWTAVTDATAYEVSTDGGLTFVTPSSGSNGLSHTVTGLNPDQTVNILVQAKALGACASLSLPYSDKTLLPDLDVFVPNTFTPNGDGKNDVLLPFSNYVQSVSMRVFNQWGQQVFNTTELNKGWDGTYKGVEQPVGVYIYVVSAVMQDGKKLTKRAL